MSKWYGSIDNRLDENKQFVKKVKVGDGVTEYSWSDRHPYEVTKVIDDNHFFIRPMKWKRTDSNGMSECQDYEYFSDLEAKEIEIVRKYNKKYYRVETITKDTPYWKSKDMTDKQREKVANGGSVKKYHQINISVGVMERYYDFSF